MNYFELFDIEQNYIIDQTRLRKQYLALQEKYHPDKAKDELQRHKNAAYSMFANEAFKVLKDEYLRAEYILKTKGEILDNDKLKSVLSAAQLEEILEEYESIESLSCNLSSLYVIKKDKIAICEKLVHDIGIAFSENNIKQALDLTVRLKYLTNLVNNIKLKIKNADN
jgi:molecular chaperone HscB